MWRRLEGGPAHVGPLGLLALAPHVDRALLAAMLAAARLFAEEWTEIRGLYQQKLAGRVLRCGSLQP